ncbi:FecR family protein [Chitiniphilus eburneus]|uniref:DUF4880 domain-containing protein n=1 Tax=Chitiniphilus eburneus TaxID=2571148 RepID=A0A4U0PZN2_9NEIS|nr:FecR domain-containing protein [Chitiniphilus eburneus]TJZ73142.1 DUF4880 domain-containing protein [Chitiniphilus eburneus]
MTKPAPRSASEVVFDPAAHYTLDEQAAAWLLRQEAGLDAAEARAMQTWLAQDPAHGRALAAMAQTWQALDALPAERIDALRISGHPAQRRGLSSGPAANDMPVRPRRAGWLKQGLVACTVLAALGGMGGVAMTEYLARPTYLAHYASQRGQMLKVTLPDGTRVHLDTATRLDVAYYRDRREVRLAGGQAMFDVAHDARHPFSVFADPLRVTVVGTRFSVRHIDADVEVEVEQGKVRVQPWRDGHAVGPGVLLTPGQAVAAVDEVLAPVRAVLPDQIAPWREGRVIFDNVPLGQALAEFARYGDTGLHIRQPEVAALRVTGSFDIAQAARFARALPRVLPVKLTPGAGGTEIERR